MREHSEGNKGSPNIIAPVIIENKLYTLTFTLTTHTYTKRKMNA